MHECTLYGILLIFKNLGMLVGLPSYKSVGPYDEDEETKCDVYSKG